MANQYIFFDQAFSERFLAFAATHGITGTVRPDAIEGMVVDLPDDMQDEVLQALEDCYDELMDEQQFAIEEIEGGALMGVTITLPEGESCMVSLPGPLGRRLVEHFSTDEIHELVLTIAENVLNPSMAPLCKRKSA